MQFNAVEECSQAIEMSRAVDLFYKHKRSAYIFVDIDVIPFLWNDDMNTRMNDEIMRKKNTKQAITRVYFVFVSGPIESNLNTQLALRLQTTVTGPGKYNAWKNSYDSYHDGLHKKDGYTKYHG